MRDDRVGTLNHFPCDFKRRILIHFFVLYLLLSANVNNLSIIGKSYGNFVGSIVVIIYFNETDGNKSSE